MAKSSRGRARKSRPVDWVVNRDSYAAVASVPNATQVAVALTLPKFWAAMIDPTLTAHVPGYSFPEQDEGQMVYAVQGHVIVQPGTWAVGSSFRMFYRLAIKPIEYDTAGVPVVITDTNYSLVRAEHANEQFLWQEVRAEQFGQGDAGEVLRIRWKGRRNIRQDEALWLFMENQSGLTQTVRHDIFLRTLMRADE